MAADCDFDILVIGGGVVGLAASYYAALAGYRVIGLEQFNFLNEYGSSKGESKFFRVMYSDRILASLAQAADPIWRDLETAASVRLREMTGLLFLGRPAGLNTAEGNLLGCKAVMNQLGIHYKEYSSPAAIQRDFPVFCRLPSDSIGMFQADAGVIYAEDTSRALIELARGCGVALHNHEPVVAIIPPRRLADGVVVNTASAQYTATKVIVSVGAWTNVLLGSLGLKLPLKIWEMTVSYHRVEEMMSDRYPLWFYFGLPEGDDGGTYYGVPPLRNSDRVKLAANFTKRVVDWPQECTHVPDERVLTLVQEFAAAHMRGLSAAPIEGSAYTCNYSVGPVFRPAIDFVPGFPDIVLFAAEGGQSFKFAPLFGKILAELAATGSTRYDIGCLSLQATGLLF